MTVDAGPARAHLLQVAESDHAQRVGTAAWLDRAVSYIPSVQPRLALAVPDRLLLARGIVRPQ